MMGRNNVFQELRFRQLGLDLPSPEDVTFTKRKLNNQGKLTIPKNERKIVGLKTGTKVDGALLFRGLDTVITYERARVTKNNLITIPASEFSGGVDQREGLSSRRQQHIIAKSASTIDPARLARVLDKDKLFNRAIFKGNIVSSGESNIVTIPNVEVQSLGISMGEELEIVLKNLEDNAFLDLRERSFIRARATGAPDVARTKTTFNIPQVTARLQNYERGDIVQVIINPTGREFLGNIRDITADQVEFESAVTDGGLAHIPSKAMDRLELDIGDEIFVKIKFLDKVADTFTRDIIAGAQFTIPKDIRQDLAIEGKRVAFVIEPAE